MKTLENISPRTIAILLFTLTMIGCKTKEKVVTKNHFMSDTQIHHRSEVHTLPTSYKTIIPCKEANQEMTVGETKVVFKTVRDTLRVFVEVPETRSVQDSTFTAKTDVKEEESHTLVTRYRVPKWAWFSLLINVGLLIWMFRGPLIALISPYISLPRFLK